jgi:hypothetical protein
MMLTLVRKLKPPAAARMFGTEHTGIAARRLPEARGRKSGVEPAGG